MTDTFTVDPDLERELAKDTPPKEFLSDDPLQCQHPGCKNKVTKPARGRTPKFCDEHKKSGSASSSGNARAWGGASEVERILNTYAEGFAFTITMVNAEDGRILAKGMPDVIHEIVELGRVDRQWRKQLERLTKPGKYGPLTISLLLGIVIPVMANHGLLPQFNLTPSTT